MGSELLNHIADPLGVGRDVVERQALALGTLDTHAHTGGLGGTHELNVDDVDIVLGGDGLERVDDRLLGLVLTIAAPPSIQKRSGAETPLLSITTSFASKLYQ